MEIEKKMESVVHCWQTVEKNPLLYMGVRSELNSVMENYALLSVIFGRSRKKVSSISCNMDIL